MINLLRRILLRDLDDGGRREQNGVEEPIYIRLIRSEKSDTCIFLRDLDDGGRNSEK